MSTIARDSKFRDEDPASRDDRSASSARLIGRVETMIKSESSQRRGGQRVDQFGKRPLGGGTKQGQTLQQLVQQLDRGRALTDLGGRSGPAQDQPPSLAAAGLQTDRGRERDRLLHGLTQLGGDLGPGQPGVDQYGQVLLVLLLELLDHQLAAAGRGPPVDPPWAVARAIVAQPVIFLLLR